MKYDTLNYRADSARYTTSSLNNGVARIRYHFGKEELSITDKLFAIAVVSLPFTLQYASPIPLISIGEFFLAPFIFAFLYDKLKKNRVERVNYCGLYLYFTLSVLTSLTAAVLPWFSFADFFSMFLRLVFYALLIYLSVARFPVHYAMRIMSLMAVVFSIYLIIQWVSANVLGQYLPTYLNRDLVFKVEADEVRINLERYYSYTFRASSLFLEPSYFSFFVCVPLAYQLLIISKENIKRSMFSSGIITIALVLSASSSGLLIGAVPWIIFCFRIIKRDSNGIIRINPSFILLIVLLITGIVVLLTSPLAAQLLIRTQDGASIGARVLRPLAIMQHMGLPEQIVGVGLNNLHNYVKYEEIYTQYDESSLSFVGLLFSSFIYSGFFCFTALLVFFILLFTNLHASFGKAVWIQFLILSIYSGLQFSARFSFLSIVILGIIHLKTVENLNNNSVVQGSS